MRACLAGLIDGLDSNSPRGGRIPCLAFENDSRYSRTFALGPRMRKVLLVCFDNVGDLVFNSALARALTGDPTVELSLLCKDYTMRLGQLLPGVQRVFAADPFWDKSPSRGKGRLFIFLKCLRAVRAAGFDEAFLSSGDWRAALALRLIGIRKVIGFRGRKNRWLLSDVLPMPSRKEPVVAGLLRSFAPRLPPGIDPHYELNRSLLPAWSSPFPDKKMVVLHAFAGSASRCAPLELWLALAEDLASRGYHVVWTGTGSELDVLRARAAGRWSPAHYIDSWATNLWDLASVWKEAYFFVGHDSGPLHVAHALKVPVLGLFLPGEPLRTFPQGPVPYKILHRDNPRNLSLDDVRSVVADLEARLADGRIE